MTRDLIAYCGLYCGDCFGYQGKLADMARDLRKELRRAKFARFAEGMPFPEFRHYNECYQVLGALVRLRCKKACRGGGGNPFCKIRQCCQQKAIQGCWQCDQFESCPELDFVRTNHADAYLKNLRVLKKAGTDSFLKGKRYW